MTEPAVAPTFIEASFGPNLRAWRRLRRLSQLELSLTANISQRHLSWLETGRSQPSRNMVVLLGEALDIPLRERNQLLNAAGFAQIYRQNQLDEEQMGAVRGTLRRMLDQQLPYPSLVVDREWNLLMTNSSASALLAQTIGEEWCPELAEGQRNLALLTLHPKGLRPLISNWDEVARPFAQRLRRDLERASDPVLRTQFESLIELVGEDGGARQMPAQELLPMLTLNLRLGHRVLRLFTVISTFGTPQDVTTDELRIETFFPADDASEKILRQLAAC